MSAIVQVVAINAWPQHGDSGVWDLTKTHKFSIGVDQDHPVRQDGVLQGRQQITGADPETIEGGEFV